MQPHIPRLRQTSIRSAGLELSAVMVACALFPPITLKGAHQRRVAQLKGSASGAISKLEGSRAFFLVVKPMAAFQLGIRVVRRFRVSA